MFSEFYIPAIGKDKHTKWIPVYNLTDEEDAFEEFLPYYDYIDCEDNCISTLRALLDGTLMSVRYIENMETILGISTSYVLRFPNRYKPGELLSMPFYRRLIGGSITGGERYNSHRRLPKIMEDIT